MRPEIAQEFGFEILDMRQFLIAELARPVIIGPNLHAPIVLTDGRRRRIGMRADIRRQTVIRGIVVISARVGTTAECAEIPAKPVHVRKNPFNRFQQGLWPDVLKKWLKERQPAGLGPQNI